MPDVGVGVGPYAELTFDADGDPAPGGREAVAGLDATDLVVFSHGWNNDRSTATRLYDRFFAPFPALLAGSPAVRLGYVGVLWPSMRFSDEPVPDFDAPAAAPAPDPGPALDAATRAALGRLWPGRARELDRIAELLATQPESEAAFAEFGSLVRALTGTGATPAPTAAAATAADGAADGAVRPAGDEAAPVPELFAGDTLTACQELLAGLVETGGGPAPAPGFSPVGALKKAWKGGKELLRQATYYEMKKRAGTVGERGLGPVLAGLTRTRPAVRVHLVGHSFGARLVSYALRGVPAGGRPVKSLTLLQGAFSHYAFADALPHDRARGGALRGLQARVDGPVVSCHSHFDGALRVFYPLASRTAGDSASFAGFDARWGAMGYDGVQGVPGAPRLTLAAALHGGLPRTGCVSVDVAEVVRSGGAPSGAHSDICHAELARIVLAAGRIGS
ncbi:serine-threonine protein kinase [Streptomyces sp. NPDC093225]|uniref:serine-threonine protein kinase n=1 Tax=Streptomyces sp. NPDC093225 TaxID=3366034 RepID=UPI0038181AD3